MPTSLAAELLYGIDRADFAAACGFPQLDDWQNRVLTSTAPRALLNCCRQSGKSTITALLSLWTALYQSPALVLILSPSERQSAECLRKVVAAYAALGQPVPSSAETLLRLELANGSRIIALPGKEANVRGYSGTTLLLLDEASRIDDALYAACRPMLAVSGGRLLMLSTPFGCRGAFWDAWEHGDGWQRVKVVADDCPRIPTDFLAAERLALGSRVYDREYNCVFDADEDSVFSAAAIAAMLDDDAAPLWTDDELALSVDDHQRYAQEKLRHGY